MFNTIVSTPISLMLGLTAIAGVTLHDTKVDKLTVALVGIPLAMAVKADGSMKSIASDPHTHAEHIGLKSHPRVKPQDKHKKHMMQKHMPKGSQGFDGYFLPVA